MEQEQHHHHHHHDGSSSHHGHSGHHHHHHHSSGYGRYGSTKNVKLTKGQRAFKVVTTVLSIAVLCVILYMGGREIGASIYDWIWY